MSGREVMDRYLAYAVLTAGLMIVSYGFKSMLGALQTTKWPATQAVITSAAVLPYRAGRPGTYRAVVSYRYQEEGQMTEGHGIYLNDTFGSDRDGLQALVDDYPAGKEVTVYRDPENPHATVLRQGLSGRITDYSALISGGFMCMVAVMAILHGKGVQGRA